MSDAATAVLRVRVELRRKPTFYSARIVLADGSVTSFFASKMAGFAVVAHLRIQGKISHEEVRSLCDQIGRSPLDDIGYSSPKEIPSFGRLLVHVGHVAQTVGIMSQRAWVH